jgi:hypothetical protein
LATRGSRSRISRDLFVSLSAAEADEAARLEWRRKRETDREYPGTPIVHPGMPSEKAVIAANTRFGTQPRRKGASDFFWERLRNLLSGDTELSLDMYMSLDMYILSRTSKLTRKSGLAFASRRGMSYTNGWRAAISCTSTPRCTRR